MNFKVEIKNIGKITDAEIHIGNFTVFAGPNNTGKSFAMKILYSLFHSMNGQHAIEHLDELRAPLFHILFSVVRDTGTVRDAFQSRYGKIASILSKCYENSKPSQALRNFESKYQDVIEIAGEMKKAVNASYANTQSWEIQEWEKNLVTGEMAKFYEKIKTTNPSGFVSEGIKRRFRQNLLLNFQSQTLQDLLDRADSPAIVSVDKVCDFKFENTNSTLSFREGGVEELEAFSNVVYIDSPIYWNFANSIDRLDGRYLPEERVALDGVPRYFHDLVQTTKERYLIEKSVFWDNSFSDISGKIIDLLNGKMSLSQNGELTFIEEDRQTPLTTTAAGIVNLGILALLLERNVLSKGFVLFVDEPEAHLHPSWQIKFVEILFDLVEKDVNVIMATHSADILKYLEVRLKKKSQKQTDKKIALNQFPFKKENVEDALDLKLAKIKQELTQPFADLYLQGL